MKRVLFLLGASLVLGACTSVSLDTNSCDGGSYVRPNCAHPSSCIDDTGDEHYFGCGGDDG